MWDVELVEVCLERDAACCEREELLEKVDSLIDEQLMEKIEKLESSRFILSYDDLRPRGGTLHLLIL